MPARFRAGLARYFTPQQLEALAAAKIGIAGAGGLGSNAAMLLARSGVENFVIVDHDYVDSSNLNRQHYWPDQLGQAKVDALKCHLLALNDRARIETLQLTLTRDTIEEVIDKAQIWVEALDEPEAKKILVEKALMAGAKVTAASGLAGFGGPPMQKRVIGNLTLVGDFVTSIDMAPPLAPRVTQAAAMLADCVLEFILNP